MGLEALRAKTLPFEEAESALVRSVVGLPPWLPEPDEHGLRYALNLARLLRVRATDRQDLDLEEQLDPLRAELLPLVEPILLGAAGVDLRGVAQAAPRIADLARAWRTRLLSAHSMRLAPDTLDSEVCEKALVLVCGGGGGVSYVFLGGFALLEQYGLTPRLLAGASMGSILLLFRARRLRYDPEEIHAIVERLSFRKLFGLLATESRYGVPGALQLYLREAIGEHLSDGQGRIITLGELAIPMLVAVTGIRSGALPHDTSYYEHLLDKHGRSPRPHLLGRLAGELRSSIGELLAQRDRLARIYLGADAETRSFDTVDAVGFSASLPGVVHYDVVREDPRMHSLLGRLFERHDLFRLVDGGIADNVPAKAAWRQVHEGAVGTRNAFVLAFDGFGPKLSQPLWFSVEQLIAQGIARNRPFIHHHKSFDQVLSPVELLPRPGRLRRAIGWGKQELLPDLPYIARMVRRFPAAA